MQPKPRLKLTGGAFSNIYTNRSKKGDRARDWAYAKKAKRQPSACIAVPIQSYLDARQG